MTRNLFVPFLFLALLWGCSAAPRKELQTARMAVAQAQHAGAPELAPDDFHQADAVLKEGEALVRRGEYEQARQILPQAAALAREALLRAREEEAVRARARALEALLAEQEKKREPAPAPEKTRKKLARVPPPPPPPPPKPPKPAPEPPAPPLTSYPVQEQESLWTIAGRKDIYGDPLLWPILYQANRDQIKDPKQVYPGQVLSIPRGLAAPEFEEAREKARRSGIFPVPPPAGE